MIYLVPNADCVCFNNNLRLFKGVKYELPQQNFPLVFFANDCNPLTLNLYEICKNFVNGRFFSPNCQNNNSVLQHNANSENNYNNSYNDISNHLAFEKNNNNIDKTSDATKTNKTENDNFNSDYNNSNNDKSFKARDDRAIEIYKNSCCCCGNIFVFLNFKPNCNAAFHTIKFKNSEIQISLSENITISISGEVLISKKNLNLAYSHFETFNDFCFVYFLGARNFVAIIKGRELFYADYYDKFEFLNDEYYFLTCLNDSLNHGRVCHISARESEKYLVYLDEFDLNLKPEFLPHVFLDCLLAGNFKYCNALLCEGLKQREPSEIANFFCEFDLFYPLNNSTFALIKKDALVGIYKFEIENNEIVNISELDFS